MSTLSAEQSLTFFNGVEHQPFNLTHSKPAPRVAMLHGFMGTPAEMHPLGQALFDAGYHVTCPLLPGFGRNVADLPHTARKQWLDAARASATECDILIGFSMGAAIALLLAAERPFTHLILVAPFTRFATAFAPVIPWLPRFTKSIAPFARADFSDPAVRSQFEAFSAELNLDDPATQAFIRRHITLPTSALAELSKLGRSAEKAAAQIQCPVLVLQGSADITVPAKFTRRLLKRFNIAVTYHEINGGHDMLKSSSFAETDTAERCLNFLTGAPAARPI